MKQVTLLLAAALWCVAVLAQQQGSPEGVFNGNVQVLFQQYNEDTLINAVLPPQETGINMYSNLIYTRGQFSAGGRIESYIPPIQGFPPGFNGSGIGYRFLRYSGDMFDITAGNFYDQFGTGMIFRSYEERDLGIDNAMDGIRLILRPMPGITLKGIYGRQRAAFDNGLVNGEGLVRAVDGEVNLNYLLESWASKDLRLSFGGSFLSKFQDGNDITKDTLQLRLPKNVAAYQMRTEIAYKNLTFNGEFVHKINDPSQDNLFTYRDGYAIFGNLSWSKKGIGVNLQYKSLDNMSFRSDRNASNFALPINFLPAITQQHTYNLAATLYPYATVINGESGYAAEVFYKIPRGSKLGGKYGTDISVNYVQVTDVPKTPFSDGSVDDVLYGYEFDGLFGQSDSVFVKDFNFTISRKFNKKWKAKYAYFNFVFNADANGVAAGFKGFAFADIHVLELNYKIKPKHTLRTEFQTLFTNQDKGDWATVLAEYTFSPHWSFSILDQYNYGNSNEDRRVHYLYGAVTYTSGSNRISVGYGKRREGVFCIGGVCRTVPASNGLEIALATTF